jgi:hypothetical protein
MKTTKNVLNLKKLIQKNTAKKLDQKEMSDVTGGIIGRRRSCAIEPPPIW